MLEQGIVQKTDTKFAFVKIYKNGSCEGCNLCDTAGPGDDKILKALNPLTASQGDWVEVTVSAKAVIGTALLIFVLPVFSLILGYLAGENIRRFLAPQAAWINSFTAAVFLAASLLFIRLYDKKAEISGSHMPRINKILYKNTQAEKDNPE